MNDSKDQFTFYMGKLIDFLEEVHSNGYDTEESQMIRDEVDRPWYEISPEQRQIAEKFIAFFSDLENEIEQLK